MAENETLFSQASVRSYRVFRDQHGREFGADVENKTQAPCGPYASRFVAPLNVPQKYIVLVDAPAGLVMINYPQWIEDTEAATRDYEAREREQAAHLFGDKAHQAIEERNPALMHRMGVAPASVEPIRAAQAGNGWILGLKQRNGDAYPMPEQAKQYFPEEKPIAEVAWDQPSEPDLTSADRAVFPVHTQFGKYVLSNGVIVQGKEAAIAAEAALKNTSLVGAGSVDNSWLSS